MSPAENLEILKCVESALETFRRNEGKLSAKDVRLKTLLMLVRTELLLEATDGAHTES